MTMSRRTFAKNAVTASALAVTGTATKAAVVDVVVVGAGAAGLSATYALQQSGFSVTCVEAANRIGGRAHTDTRTFGVPFDQGAHWLHNRALNPFVKIGKKLGLTLYRAPERFQVMQGPKKVNEKALSKEFRRVTKSIAKAAKSRMDISAAAAVSGRNEWSLTAFAHIGSLSMARDMDQVSTTDWYSVEEGNDWFCTQGFGTILTQYWAGVPVALNTKVTAIDVSGGGVVVQTNRGTIRAKAVIVTVSLGVLAAGTIRFSPGLSNPVKAALNGITMGSYNHIALKFDPGAIDVKPDTWIAYQLNEQVNGGPKGGGFLGNISGSGLFSLEIGGRFGQHLEAQGEAAMIDFATDEFATLFGSSIHRKLRKVAATRWGANPLVRGSYSGALPGHAHLRRHLRDPQGERVFLAGEATSFGEQETVSGAHKEGLRAATAVSELLS